MEQPKRGRIVQVRGASGSGKTYLMRQLMEELGSPVRVRPKDDPTKRKPSLLVWPAHGIAIVGHYDVQCGGCDTIKSRSRPYELARQVSDAGMHVLMEGLFVSQELHRSVALEADGYERHDIFLHPPIDECTANVMRRRAAVGKEAIELKQMREYHPRMMRTLERMQLAGLGRLHVFKGTTEYVGHAGLNAVRDLLGIGEQVCELSPPRAA